MFHFLKSRNIRGATGQVAFDDNGDRIYAEYEVINVKDKKKSSSVGSFYYDAVSCCSTRTTYISRSSKFLFLFCTFSFCAYKAFRIHFLRCPIIFFLFSFNQIGKTENASKNK
jgi:hypothetical protein